MVRGFGNSRTYADQVKVLALSFFGELYLVLSRSSQPMSIAAVAAMINEASTPAKIPVDIRRL